MAFVVWSLSCLLLRSRLRPLVQMLTMPNSNFYISNCFKHSPKEQLFSHLEITALHTLQNCAQHLLAIDKVNPAFIKTPSCCCPLKVSDLENPCCAAEQYHRDTKSPLQYLSSPGVSLPSSPSGWLPPLHSIPQPASLIPFSSPPTSTTPRPQCHNLRMDSSCERLPLHADLWKHCPNKACMCYCHPCGGIFFLYQP